MRTYSKKLRKYGFYLRIDTLRKRLIARAWFALAKKYGFYVGASALLVWLIGFDIWPYSAGTLAALFIYGLTFGK